MASRSEIERTLRSDGVGVIIDVWVVPGARSTEIVGVHDNALRIRVAAPAERGKANKATLKLLGGVLSSGLSLVKGASSRRKQVRAVGLNTDQVVALIEAHLAGNT